MKCRFTLFTILMMVLTIPQSVLAYDFSSIAPTGQTLYYKIIGNNVSVTYPGNYYWSPYSGYSSPSGELIIPSSVTYNGTNYTVTSIGKAAFSGRNGLISVIIPNTVTLIDEQAFHNCKGLTSVIIPNSVTAIESMAFYNCTGLSSLTIPNSVTRVGGRNVFENVRHIEYHGTASGAPWFAYSMNGVTVGDFVYTSEAKDTLIAYLGSNETVVVPNTVNSIGDNAFRECNNLTSITIPNSVIRIGNNAFRGCNSLTSLNIPSSVISIYYAAFYGCSGIGTLTIPNSVTTIQEDAFYQVRHIEYNGTATGAPWGAFSMNGITDGDFVYSNEAKDTLIAYVGNGGDIVISNTVITIDSGAFSWCSGLISVTIPNSVTAINYLAFYNCNGLISVTIPNSVISIGDNAFNNCGSLVSLTIGSSVASIGFASFSGCSSLTEITSLGVIAPLLGGATFNNVSSTIIVNIPCGSTASYQSVWERFNNFVEITRPFTIEVLSDDEAMGSVSAPITPDCYSNIAVIEASANMPLYRFGHWNDGNTDNPRTIILTQDTVFTAFFENNLFSINTITTDSIRGWTMGDTIAEYLDALAITAVANYGYHFGQWNDGVTDNPRTITLTQDTSFSAQFEKNIYSLVVATDDSVMGHTVGSRTAEYLDTMILSALPNYGYHFTQWNDGETDNPRTITLTQDTSFAALFAKNNYDITLLVDTSIHGSVTGAGTHEYLDNCSVSAVANYGYHFTTWDDGDTNNPRVITLTQDTTFTALFGKNIYTIAAIPNDTIRGMVTGGASMEYLENATITALPNYGYHFTQWNDGETDNPRTITLTQDTSFVALFAKNNYDITLLVDTSIHGSVTGAGTHEYLDNCSVSAIANYGYHFTTWDDGDTNNPRVITLTQDTSFTALFAKNVYTIATISDDTTRGIVTGGASMEYLENATITALPNYGYHFTQWNDGDTNNPRSIEATRDSLFTAFFDYNQYVLTLNVDTIIHGSVVEGGIYNYLSEQVIIATANYGFHFMAWSDADTTNPRAITLTQDTVFTALFAKNNYNVAVISADTIQGHVTGGATTEYLDTVSIAAIANYGYHFSHWNDGDTTNPRVIILTQDSILTAYFAKNRYAVIGISDDETMGVVSVSDTVEYLDSVSLLATSNYGYHFLSWNDGDTNNPRVVCITQDTSFIALFAKNQYTLSVQSNDETQGSVSDGGVFNYLDTTTIIACASEHYHFVRWNDGNMDNPREYVIVGDATLTAIFAIDTHTVSVSVNDITRGMVEVTGTEFAYGTPCTLTAEAYTGYVFSHWSNGITANPYTFAVMENTELMAIFNEEGTQGIDYIANKDNVGVLSKGDCIIIDGLNGQDVAIYTIDGKIITTLSKATEHVVIPITVTGVYIVKVGEQPARKVVVIR